MAKRGDGQKGKQARRGPVKRPARRSGTVAIIGRPNVGKSTLLNAALEQPLAIVSPVPQTTREALLGVVHHGDAEIALLDTPGFHRPKTELGRMMNVAAREAARSADVIVFMTDVPQRLATKGTANTGEPPPPARVHPGDRTLLADLKGGAPVVLVLNKIDRFRDKAEMLPLLDMLGKEHDFAAIVPISARRADGVTRVMDEVSKLLPEGTWRFEADEVTDKPTRFFAAEYVREQILQATEAEVPHAAAVVIDHYLEPAGGGAVAGAGKKPVVRIDATIHVERPGQKKILIGHGGEMLKRIGTEARRRIEELIGQQINLKLWVRVTPDWRQSIPALTELGFAKAGEDEGEAVIEAELPELAAETTEEEQS
ncbi:MAG: GTPase Era [Polyangiaceae bacterium]|nr:GTPase Era [Polyangiaceae bacterium]